MSSEKIHGPIPIRAPPLSEKASLPHQLNRVPVPQDGQKGLQNFAEIDGHVSSNFVDTPEA
jgi:hypothetical protein